MQASKKLFCVNLDTRRFLGPVVVVVVIRYVVVWLEFTDKGLNRGTVGFHAECQFTRHIRFQIYCRTQIPKAANNRSQGIVGVGQLQLNVGQWNLWRQMVGHFRVTQNAHRNGVMDLNDRASATCSRAASINAQTRNAVLAFGELENGIVTAEIVAVATGRD